jgi:chaperonin GroEL
MNKQALYGKEARDKMFVGIKKITDAVRVTMGAAGRCVLIGNAVYGNDGLLHFPTIITKDGWTVTRHFDIENPVEQRGAMLIKEAAQKTVDQAGDATTATCVLAEALISEGMKLIDEGANPMELKKGIDEAVEYVVKELQKMSIPVRGNIERVRQIATVSANNDKEIGNLIAEAISKIGYDGIIDIATSNGVDTTISVSEGVKFDNGWISPLFINNMAKETCEFENPYILLYEKKITHHSQIQSALEEILKLQKPPLLIICEDAEQEGLAFLAGNNYNKKIQVCAVKCPDFGDAKRDWMEDLALLTGATYISDIRGVKIETAKKEHFGRAKKIIVSKGETVIVEGNGGKEQIELFIDDLKELLTKAESDQEKLLIEKRIARLTGAAAVIRVGAATESELKEKMDRVDDAVKATKAAIAEGFVAGGGIAFAKTDIMIEKKAVSDLGRGWVLVNNILKQPFKQICINAGINAEEKLKEVIYQKQTIGYDVLNGKSVDMIDVGIIDSTKALRCALINAASIAGVFLTTECSIITTH